MLQKLRDRIGVYFKGIMIPRETVDKAIELMEHPHQDIASILNQVYEMTETGKEVKTQPRIESVKDHIKKAYKDILFHEELIDQSALEKSFHQDVE